MNSRDLNMLKHIGKLISAGVTGFKIEGRMKSEYYVANAVNAYRRAVDLYLKNGKAAPDGLVRELLKSSHRQYYTGFYFGDTDGVSLDTSQATGEYKFAAVVVGNENGYAVIEQRNRFKLGDTLEVLSPTKEFNKLLTIVEMQDLSGNIVTDALKVQQILKLKTDLKLEAGDILRMKA
jgi:putative protease